MSKNPGKKAGKVGARSSRFGKVTNTVKEIFGSIFSSKPRTKKGSTGKYGGKTSKRLATGGR